MTLKRKYESPEDLSNIIESAVDKSVEKSVEKAFSWQKPDVISVSKLSETMMKKIIDEIGIKTANVNTFFCIIWSVSYLLSFIHSSYRWKTFYHLKPCHANHSDGI